MLAGNLAPCNWQHKADHEEEESGSTSGYRGEHSHTPHAAKDGMGRGLIKPRTGRSGGCRVWNAVTIKRAEDPPGRRDAGARSHGESRWARRTFIMREDQGRT